MSQGFDALFAAYLADLTRRRCAPSTIENARQVLPRFFDHLREEGVHDPRRVREDDIVGFGRLLSSLKSKAGEALAPGTRAHYLAVVKAFFRFLERQGVLLYNPAAQVPLPSRRRLPRALSEAAARRLVAIPDRESVKGRRDRAILELLYGTGLRMSECVRLDLTDVDLSTGTLFVRDGKGRKDRVVPLAGQARDAIGLYLSRSRPELARWSDEAALFLARTGGRLSAMSLRVLVREYGRRARVKASCHVLRHSYATHLLAGGASIREIQKLLGHRHLTTTALYTRVDTRALATMLRLSHPRENWSPLRRGTK
jgi:site-specific recombinase XerD